MKRADHSMIFVFIAGSYTPFALAGPAARRDGHLVLWIVWGGAVAGILLKMCWPSAPRWVGVPLYLLLGWVAVWFTADDPAQRRGGRDGAAVRRRRAVQHRRHSLRAALARPVAVDVRLPRVLPRLHRGRGDLPLHRDVVRGLLARYSWVTSAADQ